MGALLGALALGKKRMKQLHKMPLKEPSMLRSVLCARHLAQASGDDSVSMARDKK